MHRATHSNDLYESSPHPTFNQHSTVATHKIKTSRHSASTSTTLSSPNSGQTIANMHATTILFAALSALAVASPINFDKQPTTDIVPPFPRGSGSPPSGFPAPSGVPRPTAVPVPRPISSASCPTNGQLVCNGPEQWGLCNWGTVQFQRVAAGTQCLGGEIVFGPGFGTNA